MGDVGVSGVGTRRELVGLGTHRIASDGKSEVWWVGYILLVLVVIIVGKRFLTSSRAACQYPSRCL